MKDYKLMLFVGLVLITVYGCSKPNVSGQWSGQIKKDSTGFSIDNIDILMNQQDNKLSGNITMLIANDVWQSSLTGIIDKNKIVFNTENKRGLYLIFNRGNSFVTAWADEYFTNSRRI